MTKRSRLDAEDSAPSEAPMGPNSDDNRLDNDDPLVRLLLNSAGDRIGQVDAALGSQGPLNADAIERRRALVRLAVQEMVAWMLNSQRFNAIGRLEESRLLALGDIRGDDDIFHLLRALALPTSRSAALQRVLDARDWNRRDRLLEQLACRISSKLASPEDSEHIALPASPAEHGLLSELATAALPEEPLRTYPLPGGKRLWQLNEDKWKCLRDQIVKVVAHEPDCME